MKRILLPFVSALIVSNIFAAQPVRYDAKVWRAVRTYDLASLSKELDRAAHAPWAGKLSAMSAAIANLATDCVRAREYRDVPAA